MKYIFKILMLMLISSNIILADKNITNDNNQSLTVASFHEKDNSIEIKSLPEIKVNLIQPQNWYLILLPIITIVIVISGLIITYRQIKSKTEESINVFNTTIKQQSELSINEIKMEVLSKNRQLWINSLRNELSEFIGLIRYIQIYLTIEKLESSNSNNVNDIIITMNKLFKCQAKIQLLINPNEDNNKKLIKLMSKITTTISEREKENIHNKVNTISKDIINISQIILKQEWEKVKKLL